eukprot:SAG31_NODE_508_length_14732_cov_75.624547_4_plen_197_part_00
MSVSHPCIPPTLCSLPIQRPDRDRAPRDAGGQHERKRACAGPGLVQAAVCFGSGRGAALLQPWSVSVLPLFPFAARVASEAGLKASGDWKLGMTGWVRARGRLAGGVFVVWQGLGAAEMDAHCSGAKVEMALTAMAGCSTLIIAGRRAAEASVGRRVARRMDAILASGGGGSRCSSAGARCQVARGQLRGGGLARG